MNKPKLRFKEFNDEWIKVTLLDTVDKNVKWSLTGGPFSSDLKQDDYTKDGIRIIQFNLPTLPEQEKIGNFLNSVDNIINQLITKIELLQQYKEV